VGRFGYIIQEPFDFLPTQEIPRDYIEKSQQGTDKGTMETSATPTFHQYKQLPEELRVQILRCRLVMPVALHYTNGPIHLQHLLLPLLLTRNRHMQELEHQIFYEENTFIADRRYINRPGLAGMTRCLGLQWVCTYHLQPNLIYVLIPTDPNQSACSAVRNLEVHIRGTVVDGCRLQPLAQQRHSSDWHYLLLEHGDALGLSQHTAWQAHFPSITKLRIVVRFERDVWRYQHADCFKHGLTAAVNDLARTHIELQPRAVEVEVRGLRCAAGSQCGGRCKDTLESFIAGKVVIRPR
jgi:hypothetical protein